MRDNLVDLRLDGGADKTDKKRMWALRRTLVLGVELRRDEEGM